MQRMKLSASVVDKITHSVLSSREQMFILPRSPLMTFEEMRDEQTKIGIAEAAAFWVDHYRSTGKQFENISLLFTIASIVQHDEYDPVLAATPI